MAISPEVAIRDAEKAIEKIAKTYPERLNSMISEMQVAADENRIEQLASLAHDLKGEAGTMGWPLVSQASGWLRQMLENADQALDPRAVSAFMQSISRLSTSDMRGETEDGVKLIKELYALCLSKGIQPA